MQKQTEPGQNYLAPQQSDFVSKLTGVNLKWLILAIVVAVLVLTGIIVAFVILLQPSNPKPTPPSPKHIMLSPMQTVTVRLEASGFASASNEWQMQGFHGNVSATMKWCLQPITSAANDVDWPVDDNCVLGQYDQPITVDLAAGSATRDKFLPLNNTVEIDIPDTPSFEGFVLFATLMNDADQGYNIKGYKIVLRSFCDKVWKSDIQAPGSTYDNGISTMISVKCVQRTADQFFVVGGTEMPRAASNQKLYRYSFDSGTKSVRFEESMELPDQISGISSSRFTALDGETILISGGQTGIDYSKRVFVANLTDFNNTIKEIAPLKYGVIDHWVYVLGRFIVLCGGNIENIEFGVTKDTNFCYQLDMGVSMELIHNSTWQKWAPLNKARRGLSGVQLNGELFAIGGKQNIHDDDDDLLNSMEYIIRPNSETKAWVLYNSTVLAKSQPFPNQTFVSTSLLNRHQFLMCGGLNMNTKSTTNHCFTFNNEISKTGGISLSVNDNLEIDLVKARKGASIIPTGKGLLAIGGDAKGTFEYYDDQSGKWQLIETTMQDHPLQNFNVIVKYKNV